VADEIPTLNIPGLPPFVMQPNGDVLVKVSAIVMFASDQTIPKAQVAQIKAWFEANSK
jgi:hypothetical protein